MTQRCKSVPSCVYLPKTNRHCYIVDDTVLFSGDCLAVNEQGGYSFFDFFTQFPDMNKKSLLHLQKIVSTFQPRYICTGHSGIRKYSPDIFAHAHESANIHLIYSHTHMNPLNSASKNLLTHMLPMMHLLKIPIKHH